MEYLSNAVMVTETLRFTGRRAVVRCPVIRVNVLQTCGAYEEESAAGESDADEEAPGEGGGRYVVRCGSCILSNYIVGNYTCTPLSGPPFSYPAIW